MRQLILQASRYGLASAAALAVDLGLLVLLADFGGMNHLIAATLSFVAGGVFLHALSVRFIFDYRRMQNPTLELTSFMCLGLVGLVINLIIIHIAADRMGLPVAVAKLCAAGCTFSASFVLRRQFLFARST